MAATLYYTSSSCSLASFIAANVSGQKLKAHVTDIKTHTFGDGKDFYAVNPKGNVPALVLADGTLLNEGIATLSWIADQKPESGLLPAAGTSDRYRALAALSWTASELHASCGPLFNPALSDDLKTFFKQRLGQKYAYLNDTVLKGNPKFLVGSKLTVADLYTYVVLSWAPYVGIDHAAYPNVKTYFEGIKALPAVEAASKLAGTGASETA